ncbi:ketoacyl reductase [Capsulimonas corticalis]|uniref:Ketoacyl reductase n=1 Tax=Capsulimonas corticalis TaxID=2219043 RepID=A0A402D3P3_9BACT|nr:SDR family NAD(P)-dependent oxidoreductase [Capsulimonas corticalis]BDI29742.1 ketoacyl reductase [Capsulimonas corticalis]
MDKRTRSILAVAGGAAVALAAGQAVRSARAYDLKGKVVLVTGGSRGLGYVLCRELARRGALVAACARDGEELKAAERKLAAEGVTLFTVSCDVKHESEVNDLIEIVTQRFGRIDVLVNNAGVIEVSPEEDLTLDDYREAIDTHFWGPLYGMQAVLPQMKARGEGRIVNISSVGGKIPVPHLAPYSASKFALVGLSGSLRAELMEDGVVVTTVCPGLMRTGSPDNAIFKGQNAKEYAWFSIGDSLPGLTISAETAANQIIDALRHGKAEAVLSLPAQIGAKLYGLSPNFLSIALRIAGAVLPEPGGIGTARAKGSESHSPLAPSPITALTQEAAAANNENVAAAQ